MRYDYVRIDEDGYAVEVEDPAVIEELDEIFDVEDEENDNWELIDEDELEIVE